MTPSPSETTALAPVEQQSYAVDWWNPKTMDEAMHLAERMAKSKLVPSDYRGKAEDIMVAWSLGAPLGLSLLSCLRHIAVINGVPSLWGDGMLGICLADPRCKDVSESMEGTGDDLTAVCRVYRRDKPTPTVGTFSVREAKDAGLWGKNVWKSYPRRMLQMRARGFALRDAFADALCGMPMAEEMRDVTSEVTVTDAPHEPEGATATERLKNRIKATQKPAEEQPLFDQEKLAEELEAKAEVLDEKSKTLDRREMFSAIMDNADDPLSATKLIEAIVLADTVEQLRHEGFKEHCQYLGDKDAGQVRKAWKRREQELEGK